MNAAFWLYALGIFVAIRSASVLAWLTVVGLTILVAMLAWRAGKRAQPAPPTPTPAKTPALPVGTVFASPNGHQRYIGHGRVVPTDAPTTSPPARARAGAARARDEKGRYARRTL